MTARFSLAHRPDAAANACPLQFHYEVRVRCARPHSLRLNQLLVGGGGGEAGGELAQALAPLNWKCPIGSAENLMVAHFRRVSTVFCYEI